VAACLEDRKGRLLSPGRGTVTNKLSRRIST